MGTVFYVYAGPVIPIRESDETDYFEMTAGKLWVVRADGQMTAGDQSFLIPRVPIPGIDRQLTFSREYVNTPFLADIAVSEPDAFSDWLTAEGIGEIVQRTNPEVIISWAVVPYWY